MGGVVERIKSLFDQDKHREISTSELIRLIYTEEYEGIKSALHDSLSRKEDKLLAQRHKSQLHRRALYHLNRLVEEDYLEVSKVQGKGEKCYTLRHKKYQQAKAKYPSQQISPLQPLQRLEKYYEQKILSTYDRRAWSQRLNAVLLEVSAEDSIEQVYTRTRTVLSQVNDVVGLRNVQRLFHYNDLHSLISFLRKLDVETRDISKQVNLYIDLHEVEQESLANDFLSAYAMIAAPLLNIIFGFKKSYLTQHKRLMNHIIKQFSQTTRKLNLQNIDVHKAPMLLGKAGVYTISDQDWNTYEKEVEGKTIGLCYSYVSIGIDVERYFKAYPSDSSFRDFLTKVTRSVVESSTLQRRSADNNFLSINKLNDQPHEFFRFAVNYIRLWNYDWQEEQKPHLQELLKTSSTKIDDFCRTEEAIFKSCGIPIRFKTTLSSAFHKFEEGFFSKRTYKKISITQRKELSSTSMQEFLSTRETLFKIFKETDRLRLFHTPPKDIQEIILEIKHLCNNYSFPLICYDFAPRKENLTLDYFMR